MTVGHYIVVMCNLYHNKKRSLFMDGLAFLELANEVVGAVGAELRDCTARLARSEEGGADWWQRQEELEREQQEASLVLDHDREA